MSAEVFVALTVWGTLVGLDLVSVPQVMIARPLVAGTVAGALAGDVGAGAMVGVVLELFALEVLPVGAVRYPDYGPAAVAGAATVAGAPGVLGLGVAVTLALVIALGGEYGIQLLRRRNAQSLRTHQAAVDAGDASAIRGVHLRSVARDAGRALALTVIGLLLAEALRRWPTVSVRGAVLVTVVTAGAGLAAAAVGIGRLAGRGLALRWFALGLAGGSVWVVFG